MPFKKWYTDGVCKEKNIQIIMLFIVNAITICGCENAVVKGGVTPKQIIDNEEKIIGYYISGEISDVSVPGMIMVFQNGVGTVYRGEAETLEELEKMRDDEILELVKDREQ